MRIFNVEAIASNITEKLASLKTSIQPPTSEELLLEIAIRMYFAAPDLSLETNYRPLKVALYVWCISYPGFDATRLSSHTSVYESVLLPYTKFQELEELAYQISRFLDLGEYYWPEPCFHWTLTPYVSRNRILNLILSIYKDITND